MKSILNPATLYPMVLLLIQLITFLFLTIWVLQRLKIIKLPFGGLEYSQVIFTCSSIFAVLLIASSGTSAVFQTYKTLQNQSTEIFKPLLSKSAQFFLVIVIFELLLAGLVFLCSRIVVWLTKGVKEIESGNIPISLLMSTIIIGLAIVLKVMAQEIIQYIIPLYLNFR